MGRPFLFHEGHMTEKTVKIEEASIQQLRDYAGTVLGLDIPRTANAETIRAKIRAATDVEEITVTEATPVDHSGTPPARPKGYHGLLGDSSKGDPLVELVISEQSGPGGKRDVFLSVNGRGMLVPRNKQVTIPYRYYEVLKNARQTLHEQNDDGSISSREVLSYQFQTIRMPSQEEIDAWMARTSKIAA
mgnify:CR=1 FL=1